MRSSLKHIFSLLIAFSVMLSVLVVFGCQKMDSAKKTPMEINVPKNLSPEMQKVLTSWKPYWEMPDFEGLPDPDDFEAWKKADKAKRAVAIQVGKAVIDEYGADVKERHLRGVRVLDIKPKNWKNKDKVLIHTHGGGFYAHAPDTLPMASVPLGDKLGIRIISVDYKLMPEKNWSILKQRDQVIDVYKALTEDEGFAPEDVGAFGCSAGGHLTLSFINALSHEGSSVPGAAVAMAPMTDFTFDSDTYTTLAENDPVISMDLWTNYTMKMLGITEAQAKDPEFSMVYDDFNNRPFPPTMFQVGTKEVLLGDSVRMYSKLRQAGVDVEIDPHDAMIHCFHSFYKTPEADLAISRAADWFTEHLDLK